MLLSLVVTLGLSTLSVSSLPQGSSLSADDPWLAVINGDTSNTNKNNDEQFPEEIDNVDYYQFQENSPRQPQQPPPPARYGDNRRVGPGPGPANYPISEGRRPQGPYQIPDNRRVAGAQVPQQAQPPQQQRPLARRPPPPPVRQPGAGLPPPPRRGPPPPVKPQQGGILDNVVNGLKGVANGVSNAASGVTCAATNIITDEKLNDDQFIKSQMDCARNLGECDEIGKQIKILAPEVIAGRCPPPCNPCIKSQIRKVMSQLSQKYPREFQQMMQTLSRRGR